MVLLSFIIGILVIKFKPNHNLDTVLESNARYYPHINDETVLKKINKPKIAVQERSPAENVAVSSGTVPEKPKKNQDIKNNDDFIPD